MFKKTALLLIMIDLGLSSCQNYLTRKYELGKTYHFVNKSQFAEFIEKQTGISTAKIYYADSIGYVNLMKSLQTKNKVGILWGFLAKDTLVDMAENNTPYKLYCKKRIQDIISAFASQCVLPETLATDKNDLLMFHLRNLKQNKPIELFDRQEKKMVILQYATGFGTYYNDLFRDVRDIIQSYEGNTELVLMCLDPVFKLK